MSAARIFPGTSHLEGIIALPASKSISNRVLILKFLSGLPLKLSNLSEAEDTLVLQKAISGSFDKVYAGDAGTVMRFMASALAITPGDHLLSGSKRLNERPVYPLVDALRQIGAGISYQGRSEEHTSELQSH